VAATVEAAAVVVVVATSVVQGGNFAGNNSQYTALTIHNHQLMLVQTILI
jgi:hypothetical protein